MTVQPQSYIKLRDANGEIISYKILDVRQHEDGWIYFDAISEHGDIQSFRTKEDKNVQEIIDG